MAATQPRTEAFEGWGSPTRRRLYALTAVLVALLALGWWGYREFTTYPGSVTVSPGTIPPGGTFHVTFTLRQPSPLVPRNALYEMDSLPDVLLVWGIVARPGEELDVYMQLGSISRVNEATFVGDIVGNPLPPGTHRISVAEAGGSSLGLGQSTVTIAR